MATINIGCITLSLIRLLIAFGIWKREGSGTENTVAGKPALNAMPAVALVAPTFCLLRAM
jgi:hypothetical protein